ncbi:MAG: EAL domain-containing protein, partial [Micromonosporaceae bacterium]
LQTLWRMDLAAEPLESEIELLTAWRSQFGRLPLSLYHRAFEAYRQIVGSLVMVFEPMMSLGTDPAAVAVTGWEALARRDADSRRAPASILRAAQVWGDQFTIERDSVLARNALLSYAAAHAESVYRHGPRAPISINVAVRSLLSDAYSRTIEDALSETGMNPGTVTLEISEQDPITPNQGEDWSPSPHEFFRRRLAALTQSLSVHFALDDFGVGHASLDRLASLALAHIKVDRAVLHHPLALEELALVIKVARLALERGDASTPRSVVVEGYDSDAPVTLEELYEVGVDNVQGYITGEPASVRLRTLSDNLKKNTATRLKNCARRH